MIDRHARRTATLSLALGASLFAFTTAAVVIAQEQATGSGDAPVRKELDEFREKSSKTAPPDRLRLYEQGIEEVRKSGVADKALKVGDRRRTSNSRTRRATKSSSPSSPREAPWC